MLPDKIYNCHIHVHRDQSIDERLKLWDEWHVEKAFVQVLYSESNPLSNQMGNADVAALIRKHPDRLVGFGKVNIDLDQLDDASAVDRLKAMGFSGLKFIGPSWNYDDERFYPIYERAAKLKMPILFHTGFLASYGEQGRLRVSSDKMRAMLLDTIARAFPALKIIMAHLGNPEFETGLYLTEQFNNIYGEFSGGGGQKPRETTLRKLFRPLPGANMADPGENLALTWFKKLCFSTDNPEPPRWVPVAQRLLDELQIPAETRELYWWKNAASLIGDI